MRMFDAYQNNFFEVFFLGFSFLNLTTEGRRETGVPDVAEQNSQINDSVKVIARHRCLYGTYALNPPPPHPHPRTYIRSLLFLLMKEKPSCFSLLIK